MSDGHVGTVVALEGKLAVVRFQRSSMCAHCGACLTAGEHEMEIRVPNDAGAAVGDRVRVELRGGQVAGASVIAYLVPLAALLLGVIAGSLVSDIAAVVGGLACCAGAYLVLRLLDRRFRRRQTFQPRMTLLTSEEEDA